MSSSTANKLTATDRRQLCKITEGRFEMLRSQLMARKNDIELILREQVMNDNNKDVKKYQDKLVALQKEMQSVKNRRDAVIAEANSKGLVVKTSYNNETGTIQPKNIDQLVKNKAAVLYKEHGAAEINLRTLELETLEKISVAGIESDEAKDFLGEIPNIDTLLPAPEALKELQA